MVVQNRTTQLNLLERINSFFKGSAELKITDGKLEITINHATLVISLPEVIGGHSS